MKSSLRSRSNQQGFTLIELVVVIVILGILAVTAAPKFIDLSSDAKAATLEGAKAAIQSARDIQYAKSAIVSGTPAYPLASEIGDLLTLDGFTENSTTKGQFDITGETNCFAIYNYATSSAMPTVTTTDSGC